MKNIALRLRYDGSRYHGWQIQKNEISVAQTVEEALEKALGTRTKVVGCGRTRESTRCATAQTSMPRRTYQWSVCRSRSIPVCRTISP